MRHRRSTMYASRPRVAHLLSATMLSALTLLCVGCADDEAASSEQDVTQTLTLRFAREQDGTLSLKSSGKRLDCTDRFKGLAGERITCARDGETVQVIVKDDHDSELPPVVAVRDLDRTRAYYTCQSSGEDVDGAPALMKCKKTSIRPRGTGGLTSPFDSQVPGLSVPNSHWLDAEHTMLRGMEPRSDEQLDELRQTGVERVLIFKNTTGKDDVAKEIAAWGLPEQDVLHVPFQWKDLPNFRTPCEQTLAALRFIRDSRAAGQRVFFHCTVGEDRTGYLAAMIALLFDRADAEDAFGADMCEHGYASGNPQKPGFVLGKLEEDLTPLYRAMAFLVQQGVLTQALEEEACSSEPVVPDDFLPAPTCGVSTLLLP